MFNHKKEFLGLVSDYPLEDIEKLELAEKLENAFIDRLNSTLLTALANEEREKFNQLMSQESIMPEEFFSYIYNNIDDVDQLVREAFEDFKKEFQEN